MQKIVLSFKILNQNFSLGAQRLQGSGRGGRRGGGNISLTGFRRQKCTAGNLVPFFELHHRNHWNKFEFQFSSQNFDIWKIFEIFWNLKIFEIFLYFSRHWAWIIDFCNWRSTTHCSNSLHMQFCPKIETKSKKKEKIFNKISLIFFLKEKFRKMTKVLKFFEFFKRKKNFYWNFSKIASKFKEKPEFPVQKWKNLIVWFLFALQKLFTNSSIFQKKKKFFYFSKKFFKWFMVAFNFFFFERPKIFIESRNRFKNLKKFCSKMLFLQNFALEIEILAK